MHQNEKPAEISNGKDLESQKIKSSEDDDNYENSMERHLPSILHCEALDLSSFLKSLLPLLHCFGTELLPVFRQSSHIQLRPQLHIIDTHTTCSRHTLWRRWAGRSWSHTSPSGSDLQYPHPSGSPRLL